MGLVKHYWMEQQEEEKAEWIREQLNDPDADEYTEGWDELAATYDESCYEAEHDYEDDWSVEGKSYFEIFVENMHACKEILEVSLSHTSSKSLLVMLHAHVVTAVEAYLSSTFIQKALSAELYMRRLVENDPAFAKRKFTIQEIFTKQESLKSDLSQYLKDLIFHNIDKVKPMYLSVFEIDFDESTWLFDAVSLRHHCVHRAGYDKDGNEIELNKESISKLIVQCSTLVNSVETAISELPEDSTSIWKSL